MSVARRYGHYHGGAKGKVVSQQVKPAPAWQARNMPASAAAVNGRPAAQGKGPSNGGGGSKVLLSNFPQDVDDAEVIDLMRKTVGPMDIRNTMMFVDKKGKPLGIGIIAFTRSDDAVRARRMYNGRIIDGNTRPPVINWTPFWISADADSERAIKLELVLDREPEEAPAANAPREQVRAKPKLINRMGRTTPDGAAPIQPQAPGATPTGPKAQLARLGRHVVTPLASEGVVSVARKRTKKGAKRVRKVVTKTDLDAEMDAYRASGTEVVA